MAFTKILCPVDFSEPSRAAMKVAADLAQASGAELLLVHAWQPPPIYGAATMVLPELADNFRLDAEQAIAAWQAEAQPLVDRTVSARVEPGSPWHVVVDAAEADPSVDLIVIATHGRSGIKRALLGSVAAQVIRHAPCPVLVTRGGRALPCKHVLCPIDFSDPSRAAVAAIPDLLAGDGRVTLMHVVELPVTYGAELPAEFTRSLDQRATRMLDEWATELAARAGRPVETCIRVGGAADQIRTLVDHDGTFDLVVVGSHGRTGLGRMLLGSVAETVARLVPCPVFIARGRSK